ncbi:MAG: glycoside hydrolase family 13 protein [Eubacteriales bacterium]|nr:glycoside hydrolase family 13 protein [Eubacteriales bacterium]
MNKSAVLHIPMSQYAYGTDENHVTIRIRTGRDDIRACTLYYGDRACRRTPVIFTEKKMELTAQTVLFDYYEAELENSYKRLCYYFELDDGIQKVLYYGDQFADGRVDDRSEYYQLPFHHRADIVNPPGWAQDAVVYNIFADSFATGKRYISGVGEEKEVSGTVCRGKRGGTIKGILENVDYLAELGVNTVYLNPIFTAGEYHKYDLIDYFHIDPCFGTDEDFGRLVERCHENGIRVIIDGVFNHCGWRFFAFEDVVRNGERSRYKDWFYELKFPVVRPADPETYPDYACFGYERMMPKLNTANPEVEEYFCRVGRYWVEKFCIDGWRLDVASEVNDGFWRKFWREVKAANPQAVLIGEVWESANHWLEGGIFDSAMNYDFRKHCRRFFGNASIDAMEFDSRATDMRMRYRSQTCFAQLNVLDSHDVSRFLSVCENDRKRYKLAVIFQMTFPGMPSIFYGDEAGLTGVEEDEYRQPMNWGETDGLFFFFQKLIALRKKEEVLRQGKFRTRSATAGSRFYCYERYCGTAGIRVMLNMEAAPVAPGKELCAGENLMSEGFDGKVLEQKGYVLLRFEG